ncbi:bifunctional diguanylate cyclase/phosphodiesterase [Paracraurococcus ruber]|nr:EAL domain-containing protein [Paracraurococcus ruber]
MVPLLAGGLGIGLAVVVAATFILLKVRERMLEDAGRELRNLSYVIADQTERTLHGVDLAMAAVLERARAAGALTAPDAFLAWAVTREAHERLRNRARILPQVGNMILLDATGRVVASSRGWPLEPNDSSDREYFTALRDGAERVLGPAVRNRGNGEWAFHLGLRVEDAEGQFLGAIVGVLELRYFEGVFGGLALAPQSAITLFLADHRLLVRTPRIEAALGQTFPPQYQVGANLQHRQGVAVRATGLDGTERVISARHLVNYGVRVHVSKPVAAVLAAWRVTAWRLAGGALLMLTMLAAAVGLAIRGIRLEAAAADRQIALQAEVAARHAEFREVIEALTQGVCRFGADGRLALANARCPEVTRLPPAALTPGATLRDLAAAAGPAASCLVQELALLAGRRLPDASMLHLPDGRVIGIGVRPMPDGGWMATFEDATDRHAAEARMRHLARHDALTNLPNRMHFHEGLEAALLRADPGGEDRIAVLLMDLDRFKQVNDTLGHPAGDELLRAAASRILHGVRTGRGGGDIVARLGGDEFAILLRAPAGVDGARATAAGVAERLVAALSQPFLLDGQEAQIGATIGTALYPEDGRSAAELMRAADLALYRAKADGRGRHCFFDRSMDAAARERRAMELDLRRMLLEQDGRDLEIHFQPIVEVATRRPTACEALVRWRRPGQEGLVSPAVFVPIAEEANLIMALGERVLRRACREAMRWPDPTLRLAVNLSPAQFRAPGLTQAVHAALAETGLAPHRLELEVTEGVMLLGTDLVFATMHELRALGVRFALDDFGTGYSSLSYLRSFPFERVKIDRDFVRDIEARPDDAAIVRAVASLSTELGMATIAEGVETEGQFRSLAAARCQEAQGYLFGAPVPGEEIVALLQRLDTAPEPAPEPVGGD